MGAAPQIGWVEYDCRSEEEKAADGDEVFEAPTRIGALRQPDIHQLFALAGMQAPDRDSSLGSASLVDPLAPLPPPPSSEPADRCATESGVRLRSTGDDDHPVVRTIDRAPKVGGTGLVRLPFESITSLSNVRITVMPQSEEVPAPAPVPASRFGVAEAVIAASAGVILFAAGLVAYTLAF